MVRDSVGRSLRVVPLVSLRLTRKDNTSVLVQLGKLEGNAIKASLGLPATAMRGGEWPFATLQRLYAQLALPHSALQTSKREVVIDQRHSERYGIRTKYVKTIFHAELWSAFEFKTNLPSATIDFSEDLCIQLEPLILLRAPHDPGKASLCSWMLPDDFAALSSSNAHSREAANEILQKFLTHEWFKGSSKLVLSSGGCCHGNLNGLEKAVRVIQFQWRCRTRPCLFSTQAMDDLVPLEQRPPHRPGESPRRMLTACSTK